MEVRIIRIGNSKGILLNKTILKRYGFENKIEVVMKKDRVELIPVNPIRKGWDEAFKRMHKLGDDELLDNDVLEDDNLEEWK